MTRSQAVVVHEDECEFERFELPDEGSGSAAVRWRTLLSADRTPSEALTMGIAEIEPGDARDLRPHRHLHPEAYYVVAGTGIVTISGKTVPIRAGSAIFIPGSEIHGALNTGAEMLRILYVFPTDSFEQVEYEFPAP